jgi:hypothetical protein
VSRDLIAIIPSERVSAQQFLAALSDNSIQAQTLGRGTAMLSTGLGSERRTTGVLIAAILSSDLSRVRVHGKLCGVTVVPLNFRGCTSRANVI